MDPDIITYELVSTKEGIPSLVVHAGGKKAAIHSTVYPSRESQAFAASFVPEKYDVAFVLGCGLGYHLLPLKETIHQYTKIIIIDRVPGLGEAIGESGVTGFLTEAGNCALLFGLSPDEVESRVEGSIDLADARGVTVIEHPASVRLFPDYYSEVKKRIARLLDRQAGNRATQRAFGGRYVRNILRNCMHLAGKRSVQELAGAFAGYPALLVTSGPSLDTHIPFLGEHQDRFFIIAVDSALPALSRRKIAPDFVVSIDPQPYIAEHYSGVDLGDAVPILSLSADPGVFGRDGGYVSLNSHPLCQLIDELMPGAIGSVDSATGTVAGDALAAARSFGFSAVALAGFDFSFIDSSIYARGTAYQRRYALLFQDRCATVECFNRAYIARASGKLMVDGRFTRKSFLRYRETVENFIAAHGGGDVYRLPGAGLPIRGAVETERDAFLDRFCPRVIDKREWRRALPRGRGNGIPEQLGHELVRLLRELPLGREVLEASLPGAAGTGGAEKLERLVDHLARKKPRD